LIVIFDVVRTELYTTGGEFRRPDGTEYIGAYHVHFNRGAMVGGFHKVESHDRLTPITRSAELLVQSIMKELVDETSNRIRSVSSSPRVSSGGGSGGY